MSLTKVLIVTYYWPPSGGAGVQRWVKLTKYFRQNGLDPYVLTVHEDHASYMQRDESLNRDVSKDVKVCKTKSFEVINYYSRLVGKKNVPTAGFSNVDNTKFTQKLVNAIRSNFFIPDPRRGWNRFAIRKGKDIIKKERIDFVITTGPPQSTHLIGMKLQEKLGVTWIADFRDPWTDIYYYDIIGHTAISKRIDKKLERKVLRRADHIITVSNPFKALFVRSVPECEPKFDIIPNGFDEEDFNDLQKQPGEAFTVSYTGTISEQYNLTGFIESMKHVQGEYPGTKIRFQIVGSVSRGIQDEIKSNALNFDYVQTVPHSEVVKYQKNADVLLLIVPDVKDSEGIVPGKVFEYLASGNAVLCLGSSGSEAGHIIERCETGKLLDRSNKSDIVAFLKQQVERYVNKEALSRNEEEVKKYTRAKQAGMIADVLNRLGN